MGRRTKYVLNDVLDDNVLNLTSAKVLKILSRVKDNGIARQGDGALSGCAVAETRVSASPSASLSLAINVDCDGCVLVGCCHVSDRRRCRIHEANRVKDGLEGG